VREKRDRLVASEQLIGIQVWFGSFLSSWQVRVRSYARTSTWHDSNLQIILVYSRCCISFIEYLIVSYYRYLSTAVSCCPFRSHVVELIVRRLPATLIVAWLVNYISNIMYIRYSNGSNFVTILPPWKYTWFHSRVDISGFNAFDKAHAAQRLAPRVRS
jgi:hypothetical protein